MLPIGLKEQIANSLQAGIQAAQTRSASRTALKQKPVVEKGTGSKAKPTTSKTAKSTTAAKKPATTPTASTAAQSQITPYLNSQDLMSLGDDVANAENTTTDSKMGLATAAANAKLATGDITRRLAQDTANANDDAAARGLYDSGIRASNVSRAGMQAANDQTRNQASLALAAAQAGAQQNAAKQQLARKLQGYVALSAERGMALPVTPTSQNGATNVPGAATVKKVPTKKVKR